ncbi:hypothetical protein HZS_2278 [Henneguya salminicola]|nr:hypothetical protein HZS_2278 [Henneguya salminicola]
MGGSTLNRDNNTARSIFKIFAAIAFIQEDNAVSRVQSIYALMFLNNISDNLILSSEDIVVTIALSHYFPFDYGINPKELKIESV